MGTNREARPLRAAAGNGCRARPDQIDTQAFLVATREAHRAVSRHRHGRPARHTDPEQERYTASHQYCVSRSWKIVTFTYLTRFDRLPAPLRLRSIEPGLDADLSRGTRSTRLPRRPPAVTPCRMLATSLSLAGAVMPTMRQVVRRTREQRRAVHHLGGRPEEASPGRCGPHGGPRPRHRLCGAPSHGRPDGTSRSVVPVLARRRCAAAVAQRRQRPSGPAIR